MQYHNPDPVARLVGKANVAVIEVNGIPLSALIDTGAQIGTIDIDFCKKQGLQIHSLETEFNLRGLGDQIVPYEGYVEVTLGIPTFQLELEKVPLLVISEPRMAQTVPVIIGMTIIENVLKHVGDSPVSQWDPAWKSAGMSLAWTQQTIQQNQKLRTDWESNTGPVHSTSTTTILPGETKLVGTDMPQVVYSKRLNVLLEPEVAQLPDGLESIPTYLSVKPGTNKATVGIVNRSQRPIQIRKGTVVGQVKTANAIPSIIPPEQPTENDEAEDITKLDTTGIDALSLEDQKKAKDLLEQYQHVFSAHSLDLGKTDLVKHKINITNETPFKERYRRIPPQLFEEVRAHVQEMLDIGAISRTHSPWASAVVLVRKKGGGLRFCIDLRKLNERTVKDAYSLPRIDDALDCLRGASLFSSLDLRAGYWQVELDEDSKPLTAFTLGPLGFYQCERMPFGLVNAPATFQRLMESCLGELHLQWCLIYLDDIIVYSSTVDDHLKRLEAVFQRLIAAGLKLKASKCDLFRTSLTYLGHVISCGGISTCEDKVEAVRNWPQPQTVTQVRGFLGFVGYYRKFIPKFGQLAKPLYLLTSGENASLKNSPVQWDEACQQAFSKLKQLCCSAPVLAYADFTRSFILHTDASTIGLGAALYQTQDGKERVIAYASRSLSKSEANYPAHKLEFLALKWAVTDKFHEYLYGSEFVVYTDNNPLTYVLTTARLDAVGQRWIAALAPYHFQIKYRSGKANVDADALSRIGWSDEAVTKIDQKGVQSMLSFACLVEPPCTFIVKDSVELKTPETPSVVQDWKVEQNKDPTLVEMIKRLRTRNPAHPVLEREGWKGLVKERPNLCLRMGVLYRKTKRPGLKQTTLQLVLPVGYRAVAIKGCHDEVGHPGMDRTYLLIADRFYWPGMKIEIEKYVTSCARCQIFKSKRQKAPMQPIQATYPLELVHLDYLTIEGPSGRDVNLLVITDHFTRYAQVYMTRTQTAQATAKAFWEGFILHYGWPEKVLTDQGRNFESQLFSELCALAGVRKLRTTPYHPQTNGQCERFNSTLISMIGTLPPDRKDKWPVLLQSLVHAYNCTRSLVTGYSPYYLLYGRVPKLPIDVQFGIHQLAGKPRLTQQYVEKLRKQMQWAWSRARLSARKEALRQKKRYDRRVTAAKLHPGDLVLVRVTTPIGKSKIRDRWSPEIYRVVAQPYPHLPVYEVSPVSGAHPSRVVHRNLLLPYHPGEGEWTPEQEGRPPHSNGVGLDRRVKGTNRDTVSGNGPVPQNGPSGSLLETDPKPRRSQRKKRTPDYYGERGS